LACRTRLDEDRRELAERQEEVQLLHAIAETLGAVTSLSEAAARILKEVVRVAGASRASLWVHDPEADELVLAAEEGSAGPPVERIPVESERSVSALVFREGRALRLNEEDDVPAALLDRFSPDPEPWLAVPVTYTSPQGSTRTVGVLNLIGGASGAGVPEARETRLITTLARQIGSAIENIRLFEESIARERLLRELRLAQDLQMKLLPELREFHDIADVAGRCVPARPVGGDFYQLFRLSEGRLGVMLGDVTSHGFAAALIMALSMSAAAIYAQETSSPGDLLRAIHRVLIQKLESTDMFLTLFYGVVDPGRGTLCYANAGHAHAFLMHGDEPPSRLSATSPPLGIAEYESYGERATDWQPGDVLCLFTDGLTTPALRTTESALVAAAAGNRQRPAADVVAAMFQARRTGGGPAPDDQTALVLRA
jgi:sigma-B regulation protein RsbU (phosphoserine phosphatase)